MKIRNKLLLYFLVISLIPMTLLTSLMFTNTSKELENNAIFEWESLVKEKSERLNEYLTQYKTLSHLLLKTPAVQEINTSHFDYQYSSILSTADKEKRLANMFMAVMQANPDIDKLRFIDKKGDEIVRLNKNEGNYYIVPQNQLQNKVERYFFKKGMSEKENGIYISPLDLNEDFKVVEVPYKPTIRFVSPVYQSYEPQGKPWTPETWQATGNQPNQRHRRGEGEAPSALPMEGATRAPVIDQQKSVKGVVVINVNMSNFLNELEKTTTGEMILIDQNGQFLMHPEEEKEFSVQKKKDYNYFKEQPELQKNLEKYEQKNHFDESKNEYRIWRKIFYDPENLQSYWVILLRIPKAEMLKNITHIKKISVLLIWVFGSLIALLAFLASKSFSTPLQKLTQAAKKIAQGQFETQGILDSSDLHDEAAILSKAFHQMIEKLQNTMKNLTESERKIQDQNEKLKLSNKQLEQFAYVASHDLQEPLRKILAFGDRLAEKAKEKLNEEEIDYLRRMTNASTRMKTLIEDLLKYSRVSTQEQKFTNLNLNQILNEVLSDLETAIERTGGKVEFSELGSLDADPLQMRQLFQNFISNALKFHKAGQGTQIHIKSETRNQFLILSIEDNGIGFDNKFKDRIFEPFQRLHGKQEYEGTGIGLAICKKIIDHHHGSIEVESEENKGSKFIITLPIQQTLKG